MTKTLTQDVFKGAPEWVRSAAVDDNGDKWIANFGKCMCLGYGYDTTNWRESAIDRE